MIKLFKRCLKLLFAVIIVAILALTAVMTLVDPNEFKPFIEKQVAIKTGHSLTIKGPIHWHLTPYPCLVIHELSLSPTASTTEFLNLKKVILGAKPWSLLSGKLLITLQLQDLDAHFNRNIIGQTDWKTVPTKFLNHKLFANFSQSFFLPYEISLEEGNIHWQDERTEQDFQINHLHFSVKKLPLGIAGAAVPFNINFQFEDKKHAHSGSLTFQSEWFLNPAIQQLNLQNLTFIADIKGITTTTFTGELQVQPFKNNPLVEGTLQTINFNVKKWLTFFELPYFSPMTKIIDVEGRFKYQSHLLEINSFRLHLDQGGALEGNLKFDLNDSQNLQTLNLHGIIQGKDLNIGPILLKEIKTSFDIKEGKYAFNEVQANFLNSNHQGNFQIDLKNPVPKILLSDNIDTPEINELLTFLGEKDKITGEAQIKTTLTTEGSTVEECLQHLSGTADVLLNHGKIQGIALPSLLQHLHETTTTISNHLLKKQSINIGAMLTAELGEWKQQSAHYQQFFTPFQKIEGHFDFQQGHANSNFILTDPEYTLKGQGTLDLTQRTIEYRTEFLLTRLTEMASLPASLITFLKETPLSIRVAGPLQNPSLTPDLAPYTEGAVRIIQKEYPENFKNHHLEKLFGSS